MPINHETVSGAVDSAAQALAADLVEAISGTADPFSLYRKIAQQPEQVPALAAIRVLGADVLSVYLLAATRFRPPTPNWFTPPSAPSPHRPAPTPTAPSGRCAIRR